MRTTSILLCVILNWIFLGDHASAKGTSPNLRQDVYVWQRAWTPAVCQSVQAHGSNFTEMAALAAEVTWEGGRPVATRVTIPYEMLRADSAKIGLALRINPFHGTFSETNAVTMALANLAVSVINEARTNGVPVRELQIDYDCADSKLEGYAHWIRAIKRAVKPVPVVITTLPTSLYHAAFTNLAALCGGYVLQVHSLDRPQSYDDAFSLCDPAAARAAVKKAGQIGVPFRVALPTYGYILAFAPNGQFVGLSAEGPAKSWPAQARLREVVADPLAIAQLVGEWAAQRPPAMQGVIWYRIPSADDSLNWRWPTLDAIVHLRLPREKASVQSRRVEAGLYEISLLNQGELDVSSRPAVVVHWQDARLVAGDALRGFELVEGQATEAKFKPKAPVRLRAGEQWTIGWIRLTHDSEVKLEIPKE